MTQIDNRIFLRLEKDATERFISPSLITSKVSRQEYHFAVRKAIFSESIAQGRFPGIIIIEKAQNLVSYLISSVPPTNTSLNAANRPKENPIIADLVHKELTRLIKTASVAVVETKTNASYPNDPSVKFIARFPLNINLPRQF